LSVISRVAEHCYWLSRYLERAENTARSLEVNRTLLLDFEVPVDQQWRPLLHTCGIHEFAGNADGESVQHFMTWDESNICSIVRSLQAARENARVVREVISAEMWERLNFYYLWLHASSARSLYDYDRSEFYAEVRRITPLIHGITDATMSHGDAWEFIRLGKYLERACQTARAVDVKHHALQATPDQGTPVENAPWVAVLMSCSGYEPFQKQRVQVERVIPQSVADFLLFDPLFPRSVVRCLRECRSAVGTVSARPGSRGPNTAELALDDVIRSLETARIEGLMCQGLHDSLLRLVGRIHEAGDAIHRTFFDVVAQAPPGMEAHPQRNGKPGEAH
jgi:uncharacterized alpha-E superfamily protein